MVTGFERCYQYDSGMRDLFLSSPWPGTIAWALIYISDYVLTITCARLYRRNVASKIVFEGSFELNPIFQRDVDSLKIVSPRFLLLLLLTSTLFTIYWVLTVPSSPGFYTFMLGAAICMELAIHVRHLGNLHLFGSSLRAPNKTQNAIPGKYRNTSCFFLEVAHHPNGGAHALFTNRQVTTIRRRHGPGR